ncbi:TVP38/TMEM64 family protein [Candidatus Poribacteria bacterium]|nr:TVP38/TMEM64 family protein [Candidatus Poribacteria bacterium]
MSRSAVEGNQAMAFTEDAVHAKPRANRRYLVKDLSRLLLITAIFIGAALVLKDPHVREHLFDIHTIRATLHPDGSLAQRFESYTAFALVSALLIALGMPRLWVSAVAGSVFGAVIGVPVALCASVAGAVGTFMLGRSLLRSTIRRRMRGRVERWTARFRENAFFWILYARLFPLSNATVTSVLCGSCDAGLGAYLAASALGFLPLTIVVAVFGSGAAKASGFQIGLAVVLLLVSVLAQRLLGSGARQRAGVLEDNAPEGDPA